MIRRRTWRNLVKTAQIARMNAAIDATLPKESTRERETPMEHLFHYPCPHEQGPRGNESIPQPNYYPLVFAQVASLLDTAQQTNDSQTRASIQLRLLQGIPGYQCPVTVEGEVAQTEADISHLYVDFIQGTSGYDTATVARAIWTAIDKLRR
jgi:hypothetical protein